MSSPPAADGAARDVALRGVYGDVVPGAPSTARGFSLSIVDGDDPARAEKVQPWVRKLAWALDEIIDLPIVGRVGLDGVLGLIPGVGEGAGMAAGWVIIVSAIASGASLATIARMVLNTGVDALFGSIPVAGQAWDFFFKSNTRNMRLLQADVADREATRRSSVKVIALSAAALVVLASVGVAVVIAMIVAANKLFT